MLSAALALAIVAVAASSLFGDHGIARLLRLRSEHEALTGDAFALLQTNRRLHEEIGQLRNDDLYLEGLARRQLGLVRPNETVYRFRRRGG